MSVEHVVILMLENHSFDEYFGTFPGANGFYSNPESAFANAWVPMPGNWAGPPILPYRLRTFSSQQSHPSGCNHGAAAQHSYYAGGAMNGWSLKSALNPVSCMGYYAADDIPYHWWLAQNFALCDNYYCSVLGPTEPNRIYLMTGTINQYGSRTSCFASELAGGA
jgi:phospholipase C